MPGPAQDPIERSSSKLAWLPLAVLAACGSSPSELSVQMHAVTGGDGILLVEVSFLPEGEDTPVALESDDVLTAALGSQTKPLTRRDDGDPRYETAFSLLGLDGAEVTVSIDRAEGEDAPRSVIAVPPPLLVDRLPSPTISRATDLTVTWSPSSPADEIAWTLTELQSRVLVASGSLASDTGSLTFPAGSIEVGPTCMVSCEVTLRIERRRRGSVDPALVRGAAIGIFATSPTFTTTL